jgi:21S rRNA (GM2251-2'-O)-methyltransferase
MAAKGREPRHLSEPGLEDELEYASEKPPRRMRATESDLSSGNNGDSRRGKTHVPLSIPYTTPASEFLYGTSAIFAALTAMRRKMYKLYVYSGENREAGGKSDSIQVLAHNRQVEVIKVDGDWLRVMDKLSKGRPHNVCQLANSPGACNWASFQN